MSDYNLTVGINLSNRKLKNTIPNNTTVSEFKYIAKVNNDNYIAEDVIDNVSKCYIHYLKNGEDYEEIFYSSDGTNINEITVPYNFGTITEIDDTASLYQYITRVAHEKVYAMDEDSNKQETMTRDEIMEFVVDLLNELLTKVNKSGDTMTGDLNLGSNQLKFGASGSVEFKENGYGDKFRIRPYFNGADDNNKLIIQGAVGGAGTDPEYVDLGYITAKNGHLHFVGNINAPNFIGKTNGYTWDLSTENTTDSWIPILSGTTIQHRTASSIMDGYGLRNIGNITNLLNSGLLKGFGKFNSDTSNRPSGIGQYGTVLILPLADSTQVGHTVIAISNDPGSKGNIAIRSYVNNTWQSNWRYIMNMNCGTSVPSSLANGEVYFQYFD